MTDNFVQLQTTIPPFVPPQGHAAIFVNESGSMFVKTPDGVTHEIGSGGGGATSDNWMPVYASGTPTENAATLSAAYESAKLLTPNGLALSAQNRVSLLLYPGIYDFGLSTLTLDAEFVDLVGVSQDRDAVWITGQSDGSGTVQHQANDSRIFNLTIDSTANVPAVFVGAYLLLSASDKIFCNNISFGPSCTDPAANIFPMQVDFVDYAGTYIDCVSPSYGFGGVGNDGSSYATGKFIRCKAGDNSFGAYGASGYFEDCEAGDNSFSTGGGASGKFIRCTAGLNSFGYFAASGEFIDCKAGNYSFGQYTADGIFSRCAAGFGSFGGLSTASGYFEDCVAGGGAFGGYSGNASGTFIRCVAETFSWGYFAGTMTGRMIGCHCSHTDGFQPATGGGIYAGCTNDAGTIFTSDTTIVTP